MTAKNSNVGWLLNFRVRVFLKSAVMSCHTISYHPVIQYFFVIIFFLGSKQAQEYDSLRIPWFCLRFAVVVVRYFFYLVLQEEKTKGS